MKIYNFDRATRVYLGEDIADADPRAKDKFLIPAFATSVEPPVVSAGFRAVFDGTDWSVEAIPAAPAAEVPTLEELQAVAVSEVADAAERARLQYITAGDGKVGVYKLKQEEAAAWKAVVEVAGTPDPDDYPFLKHRAERVNPGSPNYQAVADEWNMKATEWMAIAVVIEGLYESAVEAIGAAANEAEIALETDIAWPVSAN